MTIECSAITSPTREGHQRIPDRSGPQPWGWGLQLAQAPYGCGCRCGRGEVSGLLPFADLDVVVARTRVVRRLRCCGGAFDDRAVGEEEGAAVAGAGHGFAVQLALVER